MSEKKKYDYNEAFEASKEYFDGNELAAKVFLDKYALRDWGDNLLEKTPEDMHRRLSKEFARIESKYPNPMSEEDIFSLIDKFEYVIPQGSPMSAIGNPYHIQSSGNCFSIRPPYDSYGGIFYTDQQAAQLMKRRCVEEDSKVIVKGRGVISIKDIEVGDFILSYNIQNKNNEYREVLNKFYSDVAIEDKVKIQFSNGTILKTSKKHPILNISEDGYNYKKVKEIKEGDVCVKPSFNNLDEIINFDKKLADIGWYIGCHIGDGSAGKSTSGVRLRNVGDNENVIQKYANITNFLAGSKANYKVSTRKDYRTKCWEYICNKKTVVEIIDKYFDNMIGKKTYSANVPSFVKNNNLWIPFISGLIDSDGHIKDCGSIDIAMCSKILIDEICSFLSLCGISFTSSIRLPRRENENILYRIQIHSNREILNLFKEYMCHDLKIKKIEKSICREFSHKKYLTLQEQQEILKNYDSILYPTNRYSENKLTTMEIASRNNLSSIISLLRKDKNVGIGALNTFLDYELISLDKYKEICQRVFVKNIDKDIESSKYIDLEVSRNNNFYAGNFGLINIHNCGVGFSLSNLRPKGLPVKNSAKTTDGISVFMDRYSNTCREVAQGGRRGAEIQLLNIHHPEIKTFINIKKDKKKVTGANLSVQITDEFMKSVLDGDEFELKWPVDSNNPIVSQKVSAKELWDNIVYNAWDDAEPGILFWDTVLRNSVSNCYGKIDDAFYDTSCNPCVTGETLVYVADGRGNVPIKDLAEQGKDVNVFCYDKNGKIAIRKMRNPRITGHNKKIYKITLEGGHELKATGNHKFLMTDGSYKELQNIKEGDSVKIITKYEASLKDMFPHSNSNSQNYFWINNGNRDNAAEHRYIASYNYGRKIKKGEVVHHLDYNCQNNAPSNLKIMTKRDHDLLHSKDMKGDGNPYHKMTKEWKYSFASHPAEANPNFSGYSNDEIRQHAIILCNDKGRKFTYKEWQEYALLHKLPTSFSSWRKKEIGTISDLSLWASRKCGFSNLEVDSKNIKTYHKALDEGYNVKMVGGKVLVKKYCEYCNEEFHINYKRREISYCCQECGAAGYSLKLARDNKYNQLLMYTKLKYEKKEEPTLQEWEKECQHNKIPYRLKTNNGFANYKELKKEAEFFNHRVLKVEEDGYETVYNGTVDEFHNFFIGGLKEVAKNGKDKFIYLNNLQCGEIVMGTDSCRLLALNLFSFVENKFEEKAYFNFKKFNKIVQKAQRMMDDMVDLEIELIERILEKINSDKEPEHIKAIEKKTWIDLLETCKKGRRTGLGITGLGDTLAALGLRYGSKKSISMTEKIYKNLSLSAYRETCILAKERGAFPIFSYEVEKDNLFLNKIFNADKEIYNIYKKYGRRNVALTTTPPAGSISILAQVTSGIEPVFMLKYTRRKKVNPNDSNVKVDFVDEVGDSWQEFTVYHPKFKEWMKKTGKTDVKDSPYFKATANDIDWESSVDIQAAAQKWVCHAISKTCNLPSNATKELVEKVYLRAWKKGCKGFTVYRDGCRSGVMVEKTKDLKEKIQYHDAPKRPKVLPCDIHFTTVKGEPFFVIVGLMTGDVYEVFAGKNSIKDGNVIPKSKKNGFIKKIKRGVYALCEGDNPNDYIHKDISKYIEEDYEAITRLISSNLRHGCDVSFVTHQLEKTSGDLRSFAKAVARVLKKYISDGTAVHGEECPECRSPLMRQDGCVICTCGWTKCG